MKLSTSFFISVFIFIAAFGFSQESYGYTDSEYDHTDNEYDTIGYDYNAEESEPEDIVTEPTGPVEIPGSILYNHFYVRSVRFNNQAREAFEIGDYEASARYAALSAENAMLSDRYVSMRLAEEAFTRAHNRYTWAGNVGAATRYPLDFTRATVAYDEATDFRQDEDWESTFSASNRVIIALQNVRGLQGETGPGGRPIVLRPIGGDTTPGLPAQYTVRPWRETGDSFSAIAGRSWVYGDPHQWRILYDANRHKLPNPNNPHLILPGMIMDIPSIRGENRSGMWDPSVEY